MSLADYYNRSALAASQVLAGFDEQRIRETLDRERVGLIIGAEAAKSPEGRTLIDLLVRLVARFYPTVVIRGESGGENVIKEAVALARRINPAIEFGAEPTVEIAIGKVAADTGEWPRIFVGSDGWTAFVGTAHDYQVGNSENPLGAGIAACPV
jgi:hypothetical protein